MELNNKINYLTIDVDGKPETVEFIVCDTLEEFLSALGFDREECEEVDY